MKSTKKASFSKAFSMVDILVTMSILVISIIPIISLLIEDHRGTADIVNKVVAANHAKNVVEYLRALPYSKIDSSYNVKQKGGNKNDELFKSLPKLPENFLREIEITEFKNEFVKHKKNLKMNFKLIKVTVSDAANSQQPSSDKITIVGTVIMDKIM